jgi:hypothetical protein
MNKIVSFIGFLLLSASLLAQDGIMNTDRPNVAFSPSVLGSGVVQVQSGFYTGQSTFGIWEFAPRTTGWGLDLRLGISDRMEINGYFDDSFDDNGDSRRRFGAGLRYQIVQFDNFSLTAVGLVRNTIYTDLTDVDRIAPQFSIAGAYTINDQSSIGFDVGSDWYALDGTPTFNYALYLSRGLGKKAFVIIENYGNAYRGAFVTFFDMGLGFQIHPDFLMDINGGIASNNGLTQYQIGGGVTWKLSDGKSKQ